MDLLVRRAGDETATAKAIDASSTMTKLQEMARSCESALESAFLLAGEWMKVKAPVSDVVLNRDFGLSLRDASDVQIISQQRLGKLISHDLFVKEMVRHGVWADDVTVEDEAERLAAEGPALSSLPFPPPGERNE